MPLKPVCVPPYRGWVVLAAAFLSAMMATDTFLRDWNLDGEIDERQIIKYLKESGVAIPFPEISEGSDEPAFSQ